MGWMLLFMVVILKIPLAGACWLIWYAIKEQPDTDEEPAGGEDRGPNRRVPPHPRWPRRGPRPAGGGAGCKPPPCPQQQSLPLERPAPTYARRSTSEL
jgi:hypothetical protein